MTNPSQDSTFDVVIIGAGPVGENVADRAVQGGLSAAIVERELVGAASGRGWARSARPSLSSVPSVPSESSVSLGRLSPSALVRTTGLNDCLECDDRRAAAVAATARPSVNRPDGRRGCHRASGTRQRHLVER